MVTITLNFHNFNYIWREFGKARAILWAELNGVGKAQLDLWLAAKGI